MTLRFRNWLFFLAVMPAISQLRMLQQNSSTGAGNVPPGLEVQVAQQGTKLNDMDLNINRRLDELKTKMDAVGNVTDSLKTDVARLNVVSNIFTFGFQTVLTVFFVVPLTFLVQWAMKKRFPDQSVVPPPTQQVGPQSPTPGP